MQIFLMTALKLIPLLFLDFAGYVITPQPFFLYSFKGCSTNIRLVYLYLLLLT